jgi:serine/threonine protein phosphatase PrpC
VRVSYAAATDRGRARAFNEDFYCAEPALGLFAVADGAGPDAGGWVASRTVIRALRQFIAEAQDPHDAGWPCPFDATLSVAGNRLKAGLVMANRSLSGSAGQDATGASATIGAVLFDEELTIVANVGDCRIFLGRDGRLTEVLGDPSPRALDGAEPLTLEVLEFFSLPGDLWLLCTDGRMPRSVDAPRLDSLFQQSQSITQRVNQLIGCATTANGQDNITAILIESREEDRI